MEGEQLGRHFLLLGSICSHGIRHRVDMTSVDTWCVYLGSIWTYILLTEQLEVVPLWRHTEPILVQKIHLIASMDVRSTPLHYLVGIHCQLLHPAEEEGQIILMLSMLNGFTGNVKDLK